MREGGRRGKTIEHVKKRRGIMKELSLGIAKRRSPDVIIFLRVAVTEIDDIQAHQTNTQYTATFTIRIFPTFCRHPSASACCAL